MENPTASSEGVHDPNRRRPRIRTWVKCILGFGILVLCFLVISAIRLCLITGEDYETGRYTWGYFFVINSATVRDFPIIEPMDHPRYSYYESDLPFEEFGTVLRVQYKSRELPDKLIKKIDGYLKSRGLVVTKEYIQGKDYRNGRKPKVRYSLSLSTTPDKVTNVDFLEAPYPIPSR